MLMLVWNNIARRRAPSVMTVAITLLTIMAFVLTLGVFLTVSRGLALSQSRLGADAMLIPRYASADGEDLLFTSIPENIYMPENVLDQVRQLDGIEAITPQFYAQTLSLSCCDAGTEARIIGYDPETDFILTPYLTQIQQLGGAPDELIMGADFEDKQLLGYNYLILGKKCRVVSLLEPTGTSMDSTIFLHMDTLRQMCLDSDTLSVGWKERDPYACISVVMVRLKDGVDPKNFAKQVEQSGMDAKCILTGDTIASLREQLTVNGKVIFALWLSSLLIAGLSLLGRFSALAKDRKKEIGMLRALGIRKRQVFGLMIAETCTMALIGGILGSAAALIVMKPVIRMLESAFRLSVSVWSVSLAVTCTAAGILLALVLGFAAAVVPAVRSAAMDPQTAIAEGEIN